MIDQDLLDAVDPLGTDWKQRGERGTARLRERAILKDAEELIPAAGIEEVLVLLAGTAQGILAGIPDACRAEGAPKKLIDRITEIVQDAQLQISLALDGAAQRALDAVEAMETQIEEIAGVAPSPASALAGPKERAKRTDPKRNGTAPSTSQSKPRVKGAPVGGKKRGR